jgi:hypothetical protein
MYPLDQNEPTMSNTFDIPASSGNSIIRKKTEIF